MPDAGRRDHRVLAAQAHARAAMTATLDGAMNRDKARIDLAHAELVDAARSGLLLAAAQCMAVEFASFMAAIGQVGNFDPQELWAQWCTTIHLPEAHGG